MVYNSFMPLLDLCAYTKASLCFLITAVFKQDKMFGLKGAFISGQTLVQEDIIEQTWNTVSFQISENEKNSHEPFGQNDNHLYEDVVHSFVKKTKCRNL